ncbi:MAG TPA: helix-turn-helix domain-containing protein [Mycobacteriales bacterium]|nr:helix-turn-helix domain-containing protein [Mycobacteriales bacterium]
MVDAPDLPAALRAFRRQHGLTVRAAGRLVGGSHSVWAQWEAGVVPGPTYLRQVADLLGLTRQQARDLAGPDRVRRPGSVGEGYSHGLAQARLRAGLSAAEFARRMHVSGSLVSRWEASGRVPARHYWPLMATVLGLDLDGVAGIYAQQVARSEVALIPSLRSLRTQRGLTQLQLANTVQADVSSIQRWERHGRAPHAQARRLAAALGTDLAALARPALAPPPPKRVALPLRRLRRQTHLSARLVAARVGVSTSALLGWERGSSRPTWAQARRLARALAVPVEDVFVAAALDPPRHLDPHHWTAAQLPAILTELRRWHGSTQAELGTLVGVTAATVSAWEHGRQRPRRSALAQLERQLCHTARLTALLSR